MPTRKIVVVLKVEGGQASELAMKRFAIAEEKAALNADKLRAQTNKLNAATEKLKAQTEKIVSPLQKQGSAWAGLTNRFIAANVASRAITVGLSLLRNTLGMGIESVASFEFSMAKARAVAGVTAEEAGVLSKRIRELAVSGSLSADEIAKATLEITKMGVSVKDTTMILQPIITLATVLDEDIKRVGETVVQVKNAYGFAAKDMEMITERLFAVIGKSALDLEGFSTAFSLVGGSAKLAGVEFDDLLAAFAVLSNAGIKNSTIGTSLRQMFLGLANSTSKASKAIQAYAKDNDISNEEIQDATDKTKAAIGSLSLKNDGLYKVLQALAPSFLDVSEAQKLFRVTALSGANAIVQNRDAIIDMRSELKNMEGGLKDAQKIIDETITQAFRNLKAVIKEAFIQTEMDSFFKGLLRGMSNLMKGFIDSIKEQKALADTLKAILYLRASITKEWEKKGKFTSLSFKVGLGPSPFEQNLVEKEAEKRYAVIRNHVAEVNALKEKEGDESEAVDKKISTTTITTRTKTKEEIEKLNEDFIKAKEKELKIIKAEYDLNIKSLDQYKNKLEEVKALFLKKGFVIEASEVKNTLDSLIKGLTKVEEKAQKAGIKKVYDDLNTSLKELNAGYLEIKVAASNTFAGISEEAFRTNSTHKAIATALIGEKGAFAAMFEDSKVEEITVQFENFKEMLKLTNKELDLIEEGIKGADLPDNRKTELLERAKKGRAGIAGFEEATTSKFAKFKGAMEEGKTSTLIMTEALGALNSSVDTLSSAFSEQLVDSIFKAKGATIDWGETFLGVLKMVISEMIRMIAKIIIVKLIMKAALMAAGPATGGASIGAAAVMASGTDRIVTKPTLMLAGEAGAERVQITPRSRLNSDKAIATSTVHLNFYGDINNESQFISRVNKAMDKINKRYVNV